jgi:hypothetical protein
MDWCNFTASYLFEGIKEYKQSNKPLIKVKGCVHILSVRNIPIALVEISYSFSLNNCCNVLMFFKNISIATAMQVIFIDLVKIGALKIPGGFPRIGIVTTRHNKLATSCSHPFRDYQV